MRQSGHNGGSYARWYLSAPPLPNRIPAVHGRPRSLSTKSVARRAGGPRRPTQPCAAYSGESPHVFFVKQYYGNNARRPPGQVREHLHLSRWALFNHLTCLFVLSDPSSHWASAWTGQEQGYVCASAPHINPYRAKFVRLIALIFVACGLFPGHPFKAIPYVIGCSWKNGRQVRTQPPRYSNAVEVRRPCCGPDFSAVSANSTSRFCIIASRCIATPPRFRLSTGTVFGCGFRSWLIVSHPTLSALFRLRPLWQRSLVVVYCIISAHSVCVYVSTVFSSYTCTLDLENTCLCTPRRLPTAWSEQPRTRPWLRSPRAHTRGSCVRRMLFSFIIAFSLSTHVVVASGHQPGRGLYVPPPFTGVTPRAHTRSLITSLRSSAAPMEGVSGGDDQPPPGPPPSQAQPPAPFVVGDVVEDDDDGLEPTAIGSAGAPRPFLVPQEGGVISGAFKVTVSFCSPFGLEEEAVRQAIVKHLARSAVIVPLTVQIPRGADLSAKLATHAAARHEREAKAAAEKLLEQAARGTPVLAPPPDPSTRVVMPLVPKDSKLAQAAASAELLQARPVTIPPACPLPMTPPVWIYFWHYNSPHACDDRAESFASAFTGKLAWAQCAPRGLRHLSQTHTTRFSSGNLRGSRQFCCRSQNRKKWCLNNAPSHYKYSSQLLHVVFLRADFEQLDSAPNHFFAKVLVTNNLLSWCTFKHYQQGRSRAKISPSHHVLVPLVLCWLMTLWSGIAVGCGLAALLRSTCISPAALIMYHFIAHYCCWRHALAVTTSRFTRSTSTWRCSHRVKASCRGVHCGGSLADEGVLVYYVTLEMRPVGPILCTIIRRSVLRTLGQAAVPTLEGPVMAVEGPPGTLRTSCCGHLSSKTYIELEMVIPNICGNIRTPINTHNLPTALLSFSGLGGGPTAIPVIPPCVLPKLVRQSGGGPSYGQGSVEPTLSGVLTAAGVQSCKISGDGHCMWAAVLAAFVPTPCLKRLHQGSFYDEGVFSAIMCLRRGVWEYLDALPLVPEVRRDRAQAALAAEVCPPGPNGELPCSFRALLDSIVYSPADTWKKFKGLTNGGSLPVDAWGTDISLVALASTIQSPILSINEARLEDSLVAIPRDSSASQALRARPAVGSHRHVPVVQTAGHSPHPYGVRPLRTTTDIINTITLLRAAGYHPVIILYDGFAHYSATVPSSSLAAVGDVRGSRVPTPSTSPIIAACRSSLAKLTPRAAADHVERSALLTPPTTIDAPATNLLRMTPVRGDGDCALAAICVSMGVLSPVEAQPGRPPSQSTKDLFYNIRQLLAGAVWLMENADLLQEENKDNERRRLTDTLADEPAPGRQWQYLEDTHLACLARCLRVPIIVGHQLGFVVFMHDGTTVPPIMGHHELRERLLVLSQVSQVRPVFISSNSTGQGPNCSDHFDALCYPTIELLRLYLPTLAELPYRFRTIGDLEETVGGLILDWAAQGGPTVTTSSPARTIFVSNTPRDAKPLPSSTVSFLRPSIEQQQQIWRTLCAASTSQAAGASMTCLPRQALVGARQHNPNLGRALSRTDDAVVVVAVAQTAHNTTKRPTSTRPTSLEAKHEAAVLAGISRLEAARVQASNLVAALQSWPDDDAVVPYCQAKPGAPDSSVTVGPSGGSPPVAKSPPPPQTATSEGFAPPRASEALEDPPLYTWEADDRPIILPPTTPDFTTTSTKKDFWPLHRKHLRQRVPQWCALLASPLPYSRQTLLLRPVGVAPVTVRITFALQAYLHYRASQPPDNDPATTTRPLSSALVAVFRAERFLLNYGQTAYRTWVAWARASTTTPPCKMSMITTEERATKKPKPSRHLAVVTQATIFPNGKLGNLPSPPPPPPLVSDQPSELFSIAALRLVSYNCCGLSSHALAGLRAANVAMPEILCLQETKRTSPTFPYDVQRCLEPYDCFHEIATLCLARKGGGALRRPDGPSPLVDSTPRPRPHCQDDRTGRTTQSHYASGGLITAVSPRLRGLVVVTPTPLRFRGLVLEVHLQLQPRTLVVINVYAPPDKRHATVLDYIADRAKVVAAQGAECILVGDFNAAFRDTDRRNAVGQPPSDQTTARDIHYRVWLGPLGFRPIDLNLRPHTYSSLSCSHPRSARIDDALIPIGFTGDSTADTLNTGRADHTPLVVTLSATNPWLTPNPPPTLVPPPRSAAQAAKGTIFRRFRKAERITANLVMHNASLTQQLLSPDPTLPIATQIGNFAAGLYAVQRTVTEDNAPERFRSPLPTTSGEACDYSFSRSFRRQLLLLHTELQELRGAVLLAIENADLLTAKAKGVEHKVALQEYRKVQAQALAESKQKSVARIREQLSTKPKPIIRRILDGPASKRGPQAGEVVLDPLTGRTTRDPDRVRAILQDHFAKQGHTDIPPRPPGGQVPWSKGLDNVQLPQGDGVSNKHLLTPEVFLTLINKLPTGRAAGHDELVYETIKALARPVKLALYGIVMQMYDAADIPDHFKQSKIWLLIKNHKPENPVNLRPISLLSVLHKLFTACVGYLLCSYVEFHNIISPAQRGFRSARSTSDLHLMLLAALEDATINRAKLQLLYVDWKQAFPSIPHDRLFDILERFNIPCDLMAVIRALYDGQRTTVCTPYGPTEEFEITVGGLQGEKLTPMLWLLFMQPLLLWLEAGARGYAFSQRTPDNRTVRLAHLTFADDCAIPTSVASNMQIQVAKLFEFNQWCGTLGLGIPKCALTGLCWPDPDSSAPGDATALRRELCHITYRGQGQPHGIPFPFLSASLPYPYLGLLIRADLNGKDQFEKLLAQVKDRCCKISSFKPASGEQKVMLLEQCVNGKAIYTALACVYTPNGVEALDRVVRCAARRALQTEQGTSTLVVNLSKDLHGSGVNSIAGMLSEQAFHRTADWIRDVTIVGDVMRCMLRAYYVRAGVHPLSNLPNLRSDPHCSLPFASRIMLLHNHPAHNQVRVVADDERLNIPNFGPSALPLAACYEGLAPAASPGGLTQILQLAAIGITDVAQLLQPVLPQGGQAKLITLRFFSSPTTIVKNSLAAPGAGYQNSSRKVSAAGPKWAITPITNLIAYLSCTASETTPVVHGRGMRTLHSLAPSLALRLRGAPPNRRIDPSQRRLTNLVPNCPVINHTQHNPFIAPEEHVAHVNYEGMNRLTLPDGSSWTTWIDGKYMADHGLQFKIRRPRRTSPTLRYRCERSDDTREWNVRILAERAAGNHRQLLLRFGPFVCTKAEIEQDLEQGYDLDPTEKLHFDDDTGGPWPVPPGFVVGKGPNDPIPFVDFTAPALAGRASYAEIDSYDREHMWLAYYLPMWEDQTISNVTPPQYQEFCNSRQTLPSPPGVSPQQATQAAVQGVNPHQRETYPHLPVHRAKVPPTPPTPNLTTEAVDTNPELDAKPTGAYEVFCPLPHRVGAGENPYPGGRETFLALHSDTGRCNIILHSLWLRRLYNQFCARISCPPAVPSSSSWSLDETRQQALRASSTLLLVSGLHRWGPATEPRLREQWAELHAPPPLSKLYNDALVGGRMQGALNLSFNPVDLRSLLLPAISPNESHVGFALIAPPMEYKWDGKYYLTLSRKPSTARRQLEKAISDARGGGIAYGVIVATLDSLVLSDSLLAFPEIHVAGIVQPSPAQKEAYHAFTKQVSSVQAIPDSIAPHVLMVVANSEGQNELGSPCDLIAFQQAHRRHLPPTSGPVCRVLASTLQAICVARSRMTRSRLNTPRTAIVPTTTRVADTTDDDPLPPAATSPPLGPLSALCLNAAIPNTIPNAWEEHGRGASAPPHPGLRYDPESPSSLYIYTDGSCVKKELDTGATVTSAAAAVFCAPTQSRAATGAAFTFHATQQSFIAETYAAIEAVGIGGRLAATSHDIATVYIFSDCLSLIHKAGSYAQFPHRFETDTYRWMLDALCKAAAAWPSLRFIIVKCKGHSGIWGNEMADRIAGDLAIGFHPADMEGGIVLVKEAELREPQDGRAGVSLVLHRLLPRLNPPQPPPQPTTTVGRADCEQHLRAHQPPVKTYRGDIPSAPAVHGPDQKVLKAMRFGDEVHRLATTKSATNPAKHNTMLRKLHANGAHSLDYLLHKDIAIPDSALHTDFTNLIWAAKGRDALRAGLRRARYGTCLTRLKLHQRAPRTFLDGLCLFCRSKEPPLPVDTEEHWLSGLCRCPGHGKLGNNRHSKGCAIVADLVSGWIRQDDLWDYTADAAGFRCTGTSSRTLPPYLCQGLQSAAARTAGLARLSPDHVLVQYSSDKPGPRRIFIFDTKFNYEENLEAANTQNTLHYAGLAAELRSHFHLAPDMVEVLTIATGSTGCIPYRTLTNLNKIGDAIRLSQGPAAVREARGQVLAATRKLSHVAMEAAEAMVAIRERKDRTNPAMQYPGHVQKGRPPLHHDLSGEEEADRCSDSDKDDSDEGGGGAQDINTRSMLNHRRARARPPPFVSETLNCVAPNPTVDVAAPIATGSRRKRTSAGGDEEGDVAEQACLPAIATRRRVTAAVPSHSASQAAPTSPTPAPPPPAAQVPVGRCHPHTNKRARSPRTASDPLPTSVLEQGGGGSSSRRAAVSEIVAAAGSLPAAGGAGHQDDDAARGGGQGKGGSSEDEADEFVPLFTDRSDGGKQRRRRLRRRLQPPPRGATKRKRRKDAE